MKISLRKANALQLLLKEQIKEPFVGSVLVGKYDTPSEVIAAATAKLHATLSKKENLVDALFSIRTKVGDASAKVGISSLLTDLAKLEAKSAFLKQLSGSKPAPKLETVEATLVDMKKESASSSSYYRETTVDVPLFTKEEIENFTNELMNVRKSKQSISDKLLHLNVSTEIELDKDEVKVLTDFNLI